MVMSKRVGRDVVYEMIVDSRIEIRVCVRVRVGVGVRIRVRCGVRGRFSIVASGWLLILLRFNDLKILIKNT
jgi:hypothetical protein